MELFRFFVRFFMVVEFRWVLLRIFVFLFIIIEIVFFFFLILFVIVFEMCLWRFFMVKEFLRRYVVRKWFKGKGV